MHDIDRALFESQPQTETWGEVSGNPGEVQETYESPGAFESAAYEAPGAYEQGPSYAGETWGESTAYEEEGNELGLATELLEITSEEELDRFLGKLVSGAVSAAKSFATSDAGRAVGRILRSSAKRALPQLGQAVGDYLAPGAGGKAGRQVGGWLSRQFESGLHLEGLSGEDRDLETARAFVRFANSTVQQAAATPATVPGTVAARQAATTAARQHLPGLLGPSRGGHPAASGRWVRRGRNIVILGAS